MPVNNPPGFNSDFADFDSIPQVITLPSSALILAYDPARSAGDRLVKITYENALPTGSEGSGNTEEGLALTHSNNGDTNGLIYYLGSNKLTNTFTNPHPDYITMSTSGGHQDNPPILVTDRSDDTVFISDNTANSYIQFFIKTGKLKPTHYSLKTNQLNFHCLRSWKLEANVDSASNWEVLDTQSNNSSFGNDLWLTLPVSTSKAYSFFRLTQTDVNSSGALILLLKEWEFYGVFIEN
jgi:hypothetical protein